jgi:hypothetical protein
MKYLLQSLLVYFLDIHYSLLPLSEDALHDKFVVEVVVPEAAKLDGAGAVVSAAPATIFVIFNFTIRDRFTWSWNSLYFIETHTCRSCDSCVSYSK